MGVLILACDIQIPEIPTKSNLSKGDGCKCEARDRHERVDMFRSFWCLYMRSRVREKGRSKYLVEQGKFEYTVKNFDGYARSW